MAFRYGLAALAAAVVSVPAWATTVTVIGPGTLYTHTGTSN
ncbi:MAG: hypothetical protein ACK4PI_01050 [Tepidisphaerales bacterium]